MSIVSARSASPENAWTTLYGDLVRDSGIVVPSFSWPDPSASSEMYIAPSRVLTLIAATGLGAELRGRLDLEGDVDLAVLEPDLGDLADADAGDADLVVELEPAGLGEGGVVGVAAADQG